MPVSCSKSRLLHFRATIRRWYESNARDFPWRRKGLSSYKVLISEILLQRTRAETIASYYKTFFHKYPSWKSLSKSSNASLYASLKPIGLWRQRARTLTSLSRIMHSANGELASSRQELENLPGVGQYIASAVLAIQFNKREPLLDVNMARLLERFFGPRKLADIRYDPYLQQLAREVLPTREIKEFNWAVLDFASAICTARNPNHDHCPLKSRCKFQRQHHHKRKSKG